MMKDEDLREECVTGLVKLADEDRVKNTRTENGQLGLAMWRELITLTK